MQKLCSSKISPEWGDVTRIVYCTAFIKQHEGGQARQGASHQSLYVKALQSHIPVLAVIEGTFKEPKKRGRVISPKALLDQQVTIKTWEEKGSDVNVAAHLLWDVLTGEVDRAVVISNDSDLAGALEMTRRHTAVGILNPFPRPRGSRALDQYAGFALRLSETEAKNRQFPHWLNQITEDDYRGCQLPERVGNLVKPLGW